MAKRTGITNKHRKEVLELVDTLSKQRINVSEAYIFGSRARGDHHKHSDLDVFIVSESFKTPGQAFRTIAKVRHSNDKFNNIEAFGGNKDYLENAFAELPHAIKREGIRVY